MVVLVSFVLVLAAAVTLVVGLLQSGLTLIYVSIACSVVAGLVLALAVLRGRPEPKAAPAGRPMAAPAPPPPAPTRTFEPPPAREPEPATVGRGWASPSAETPEAPAPAPPPPPPARPPQDATQAAGVALLGRLRRKGGQPEPEEAPAPEPEEPAEPEEAAVAVEPERRDVTEEIGVPAPTGGEGFPIPDYDRLRATAIIGRLSDLDRGQLEQVREREASTKNRFTVLNRVNARLEELQEPGWDIGDEEWDGAADEAADAEYTEVDVVVESEPGGDAGFPIPDYESLRVSQILPLLGTLTPAERDQVRQREEQGRRRSTILDRIRRLDGGDGGTEAIVLPPAAPAAPKRAGRKRAAAPADAAPEPEKAPARKARAPRKAAAPAAPAAEATGAAAPARATRGAAKGAGGRTPGAKRSEAVKKAAPAKKAPAKKAPTKQTVAKKVTAKKATAKKATAKKAR